MVLAPGPRLEVEDLPQDMREETVDGEEAYRPNGETLPLRDAIDAFTRDYVRRTLAASRGQQTEAARRLGMPQSNLSRLMKRLGLR